ncbi:hypothetical protein PISL3812_03380 [Talaromyces islandicus]|uniref:Major facilitator superfamily (MFS) profile domain-containing protein n=1 Tax=Talaromyces islandicus TaxID=28573 RepID=A0A0U1LSL3_TALIS|nr:hypothetical protein PISL3812_03380 [Talaromyces islandicus]
MATAFVSGLICMSASCRSFSDSSRRERLVWLVGIVDRGLELAGSMVNALREVASFILYTCAYNLSWAACSYIVVSEAASTHIKEKTNLFAGVISILITFLTSFTVPYLLKAPYADLGAKVGFIYGSLCTVMVVVAYLFIPELKGRSLEEVDQLFASGRPLREFTKIQTKPVDERDHVLGTNRKKENDSTSVHV